MKILHLTDIHGKVENIKKISTWMKAADMVIISGDITHFGRKKDTETILDEIEKSNSNILAVSGNCDYPDVEDLLLSHGYFLNNEIVVRNNLSFLGLSGSLPCPGSTPNEFSEDQYKFKLEMLKEKITADIPLIFISHQPPHKTKNDRIALGMHVGSKAIRSFIEDVQPLICFTGHIHEGKAVDEIGNTKVINPGPFKNGRFSLITLENSNVHVELKKI